MIQRDLNDGTYASYDAEVPAPVSTGPRTLREIAYEIAADWTNVNYAAVPYLDAMKTLDLVTDRYYEDTGKSVVLYFLSNARSWRGETAKRVKAELKGMIK